MEEKIDREEALAEAWDRLDGKDPDAAELACEFEARERQDQLRKELGQLKAQLGDA